ncbi:hypothetical protein ACQPUY_08360 [Clostridium nigeriense]|uniref:hypothetical protein n=1 Tax=Clostridium nigeriense TaxID=1805470 RepID=UPI003D33C4A7
MISKEIINIKANISANIYKISILKKEIENLSITREKSFKEFTEIVVDKNYKNYCFSCEENISSSDEFCIRCGGYKCSWCKSCGCNYMNSSVSSRYKRILKNNMEAKRLKKHIDSIDDKKNLYSKQLKDIRSDIDSYHKKINKFIKNGVKNET